MKNISICFHVSIMDEINDEAHSFVLSQRRQ